jgi:hypothetical protein
MKKYYLLLLFFLLTVVRLSAQTTETFEDETAGSTSFSNNGQTFNITSQLQGPFDIYNNGVNNYGWNGTSADLASIDNSSFTVNNLPVEFTISSAGAVQFTLKSMYLYLANANSSIPPSSGSCSIIGKLGGATVFTATSSTGFTTSLGTNNGFTFIDMTNFGGSNNSTINIDSFVVKTTGSIAYVSMDAMRWQASVAAVAPTVTTTAATNVGAVKATLGGNVSSDGGATVNDRGIVWGLTLNPTTSNNKVQIGTGTGTFSSAIGSLPSSTLIHFRAYAINTAGTSYGSDQTFTTNAPLSAAQSQTNACNGTNNGTATVTVSSGKTPYTYTWSNTATTATVTNLAPNTYSVLITDGDGTSLSKNFTITQSTAISGTTSVTAVSCNGGTNGAINLTPTGGTGSYTFNWGGGVTTEDRTGLAAGTYSVTITDTNGCTGTVSGISVTQPAIVSGTTVVTPVSCFGGNNGAINITPTGGSGSYTFNWGGGITTEDRTGLTAGTYSVTITDQNSCTGTVSSIVVGQPTAVVSGTTVVTNVSCFGGNNGAINLTPTGGSGSYTFNWGGGITTEDRTGLTAGTYSVTITDLNSCTGTVSSIVVGQPTAAVSGTTVVTNVSCFGGNNGAINLTPTGGAGSYTFNWGGGITTEDRTGLTAGTYSVTITDTNSCTGTVSSIVVGQPAAAVSGTTVVTNVSCFGGNNGAINLTPTGGSGSYTFNWGGGITTEDRTGLAAGTYSVTITDTNSCTGTVSSIVVGQPAVVSGTTVVTNVSCFGGNNGAINLTPTGGSGSYTFNWGGGITTEDRTGLAAGTYSVTITDTNSCTGTVSSIVVGQPTAVVSGTTVVTNVSCFGGNNGAINLTPTGGTSPYTFNWASGPTTEDRTGLATGTYSVTITDANGCTGTVSGIAVTQPAAVVSGTSVVTNVSCFGGTNGAINLTPTGGTGPYTFNWASGPTTEDRTGLAIGTYSVTITDANGCTGTVSGIAVTQPAAVVSGTTVVTNVACFGGTTGAINLTPSGGTGPYTYNWGGSVTTEDRTLLAAGTYSVTITDLNGCTATVSGIAVTQPTVLGGTTAVTNVSCNGGSNGVVNLTPTGGTSPYTFDWGGGITTEDLTFVPTGTYSVTITDAHSCTATISGISVGQPVASLSGSTVVTNVSCFGGTNGTINLTVSGGTTPYSYSWGGGVTTEDRTGLAAGTYSVTVTDNNACQTIVSGIVVGQPTAVVSGTTVVTNIACNGGTTGAINLTPAGGTAPYTYNWGGGVTTEDRTGLATGTYSVTITDTKGCTATVSGIAVTQPAAALNANPTQTNVSCNGGSNGIATVAPSGGTGSYSYLWSNAATTASISGLASGTYTVTITDANLCEKIQSFTITEPPVLVATQGTINNVSCNSGANGSATVVVTGGTTPYAYDWNGTPIGDGTATISGLAQGTYTVTVTDAKLCQATQSFTITQPAALTATTSQTDILCNGGATGVATVAASGGTGAYTYLWSPSGGTGASATGLTAGNYSVVIKDANLCQITKNFTINQPLALVATAGAQTNVNCRTEATGSATVNVTGGTGAYTYSWAPSGGTAATAAGLTAGTYTVTVKDANLCQTTQSFTITQPAAVLATTAGTVNNVSCNGGANGSATVNVTGGTTPYAYDWNGTPIGDGTASISGLAAGTYTITVTDANACQTTRSFTITQPAALTATFGTQTNVSCNGGANGSATVSVTGGTGTYTYSWAPSGGTGASATGLTAGTYTVTVKDANLCQTTQSFTITQPLLLSATISKTDVLCNGQANGTVAVVASGGTPGYTYLWSPSGGTGSTATGMSIGNYSCLITDANGCTTTQNITINQPSVLTATTAQQNATCIAPGQASVTPAGGAGGYTYIWSPSGVTTQLATGLAAGNQTCLITDANGCTLTKNFTITTTNTLVATTSKTDVLCNGANTGSATVVPSGAPGPYTYVWSPSGGNAATASNLTAGNYSVIITASNGCSITKNFTITQPSALIATAGTQTNVSCNGGANGSASVTVSGGTGAYTYLWAPSGGTGASATGLTAGTYTVTVKDANLCQTIQSFTITQPAVLTATADAQTNVLCNGGATGSATVNVTGGTGAYTYLWAPSGGTGASATGLTAGTYTVTVKDANLCQTTQSFTITQPAVLTATAGAQTNVLCNGGATGSATVNVTGGTGAYTYLWVPSGGTGASATGLTAGTYTVTVKDANLCQTTQSFTITQPTALVATAGTQFNVSCNGGATGSATVNVTGGTGAYTYLWAPSGGTGASATGLTAGTYTVTVTDANLCQTTQSFTLTQPAALAATTSQTNATCNGVSNGAATVTVTGGTGAYTYLWAPSGGTGASATGLAAGNYTVTIKDANLCQLIKNFTITESAPLTATTTQTNVSCNGSNNGTAGVTVTGGTNTYTYVWAPSGGTAATANGLAPGNYTVTITDGNGCILTKNFTITQPAVLAATTTQTNILCNGASTGAAGVTVTGGTVSYTYLWSPSGGTGATATALAAGNYSVLITDANGCTLTKTFTITSPPALTATTTQTNLLCFGAATGSATVTVSGGTGAYTYAWAPSGGTAATANSLSAGTYTCTITDANGCILTRTVTITAPAALTATTTQTNILCFGAATGSVTVSATGGTGAYTYAWAPSGGTAATAAALAAGTYTCTITDANGCILTKTVTITQTPVLTVNGSSNNISCNGTANGVAGVSVTGGTAPYTYSWSPYGGTAAVATGLSGGTYVCTVTDANGCTKTRTFIILEQTSLVVTSVKTNLLCHGATNGSATVSATGGVPNYSYAWSTGAGGPTLTGLAEGTYTCTVTDALGCSVVHTVNITAPDALAVAINQTNVSCSGNNDGSLGVAVTGGTGPYTYAWTPNLGTGAILTGLAVGNYSVTITDANGCSTLRNFSLSQPAPLSATLATTDVNCFGGNDGTALAIVTGGTPPFTYSWIAPGGGTPDPLNLVSGTYTVTITDANGCTFTGSVTINQPQQLLVSNQPQNATINAGGNATYTVNAVNASSFQWQVSEDETNWANVTNGGTNPAYSGATTNSLTISGAPSGYNGYSYRVILSNGSSCTIMSNPALLTIENVLEAVDDDFSATNIITGTGGIAGDVTANDLLNNLSVNDADVVATVIDNDGLFGAAIDADGNLIVPPTAVMGTYTITYSLCEQADLTNCSTAEAIVVVSDVTERVDFDKLKLSLFPNPATTEVFIKIPDFSSHKNVKVSIHDLNGRLVKESNITSELQSIAVTGLESGVYVFKITSDTAQASRQIIINNRF